MSIAEWYKSIPIVTRTYLTMSFLTTVGCTLEIITPYRIYYSSQLVYRDFELWRLVTNFFFFGHLGLDLCFHMIFLFKYSKSLEEGSFRGRSADFLWMLLFGGALLTCMAHFTSIVFLGASLTFMMVYVWARRNQYVTLNFLGFFQFKAPYLPWVLLAVSFLLASGKTWKESSIQVDLMGIAAGHAYYFLEDVYPRMSGRRPLKTPAIVKALFPAEDIVAPAFNMPPAPHYAREEPEAAGLGAGGAEAGAPPAAAAAADGRPQHPHAD